MSDTVRLDSVERAIADIAAGKAVVVVDDEDRENEGDIIFAAATRATSSGSPRPGCRPRRGSSPPTATG
jgi:hypothetical protein